MFAPKASCLPTTGRPSKTPGPARRHRVSGRPADLGWRLRAADSALGGRHPAGAPRLSPRSRSLIAAKKSPAGQPPWAAAETLTDTIARALPAPSSHSRGKGERRGERRQRRWRGGAVTGSCEGEDGTTGWGHRPIGRVERGWLMRSEPACAVEAGWRLVAGRRAQRPGGGGCARLCAVCWLLAG